MLKKMLALGSCLVLVACQAGGNPSSNADATKSKSKHVTYTYDKHDKLTSQADSATTIELSGHTTKISGPGAKEKEGTLTISQGGTYVLSGHYKGNILVKAEADAIVHIILKGVNLESSVANPFKIQESEKTIITLANDTKNTITANSTSKSKAAIYSQSHLTLNGQGSLNIEGQKQNGIQSQKNLVLLSGNYDITAEKEGLVGKDALVVQEASIAVTSQDDALVSTAEGKKGKGYILIEGGNLTISSAKDAIQSATTTELTGGTYTITTTGDLADDTSSKGIKSDGLVAISDGDYSINASDDSINSLDLDISGGRMTLASGDDAIHADRNLRVSGGDITVTQGFEALEGADILISGGLLNLTAADDAINASTDSETEEARTEITGGTLQLNSGGDGIDINGDLIVSGGEITVFASPDSENMVIDYDNEFKLQGGTLVGAGTVGMVGDAPYARMVTEYSQPTITTMVPAQIAGGQISVTDSAGNQVASFAPTVNYAYLIISSPNIITGETYTVSLNGQPLTVTQAMVSQPAGN